jgi:hypothetical protein
MGVCLWGACLSAPASFRQPARSQHEQHKKSKRMQAHAKRMQTLGAPTWYVLRGDWLWSGNGMIDAHTPKISEGWISQCVYVLVYARPSLRFLSY